MATRRRPRSLKKPAGRFHHGDLRAAAIDVAVEEIERHGHGGLSLEGIAKKLRVTRPALYRHFSDRRALLQEAAQKVFVRFESTLTQAFFGKRDPWEALHAVGLAYVRFAVENRGWFRLQFTSSTDERPRPDLEAAPARYYEKMLEALRTIYGEEDRVIQGRYLMLWSQIHGISMLMVERVLGLPDDDSRTLHEGTLGLFMEQLRAKSPKKR